MFGFFIIILCSFLAVSMVGYVLFLTDNSFDEIEEFFKLKKFKRKFKKENQMKMEEWEKMVNYRNSVKPTPIKYDKCKYCKYYFKSFNSDYGKYENGFCKIERKNGKSLEKCKVYANWGCSNYEF